MIAADWQDPGAQSPTLYLDGTDAPDRAADGGDLLDDDFLVLINASWEPLQFTVPATGTGQVWLAEIDTFDPGRVDPATRLGAADSVTVGPRPSSRSGGRSRADRRVSPGPGHRSGGRPLARGTYDARPPRRAPSAGPHRSGATAAPRGGGHGAHSVLRTDPVATSGLCRAVIHIGRCSAGSAGAVWSARSA